MKSFKERLAAAKVAPKPKSDPVFVVLDGELTEFVFYRAESGVWAEATAKYPSRPDVLIDLRYGYNFHAVCKEVAPVTGRLVEDGEEQELSPEDWADIFSVIAGGGEFSSVTDAIWSVNEWDPAAAVERLKKASRGSSKAKRS
jgi:hypothetical protein